MADLSSEISNVEDPSTLISQGRRHLLVHDYNAAVSALAIGCQLLAEKHGDTADELAEPYLLYGRSLLSLSREEAGVLGVGVPGAEEGEEAVEEDDAEEEDAAEEEKTENKQSEEAKKDEKEEEPKSAEKSETAESSQSASSKPEESKAESSVVNGGASTSGQQVNGHAHDSDEEGEELSNNDEDENTNLQLAWEVLELSKLILIKRGEDGWKFLAEAHRLLGEVAMESGNQIGALTDFNACLDLLNRLEPKDSRSIAETHYHLGLAHSLGNDFDDSIEQFQKAVTLLQARISELESLSGNDSAETEIKELKGLLPDIQEKITDMKDYKKEACRLIIENIKSAMGSGNCSNGAGPSTAEPSSSSSSSEAKPASDISHLVRKKRKPEETEVDDAACSPCKKPTSEPA